MRAHVLGFIDRLRRDGVRLSIAESLDAVQALAVVGIERDGLREALATTLVKDERDRAGFDRRFEEWFPLLPATGAPHRRERRAAGGAPTVPHGGRGGAGEGDRGRRDEPQPDPTSGRPAVSAGRRSDRQRGPTIAPPSPSAPSLSRRPIQQFSAHDVQEARELVERLGWQLRARLARRTRRARRGTLDIRRTLRRAIASGGVPLGLTYKRRAPRRLDLVAVCDASGSVAAVSDLLLGLIAPAADYFRRAECFVYVDRLCAVSIEHGHVAPEGELDLYARSDFGRVLSDLCRAERLLTRHTVLLVLGDARNNRRPPRPELLRALRARVRAVYWVNPEPRARWNTGDSVLGLYAPSCDAVLPGETIEELVAAVRALA